MPVTIPFSNEFANFSEEVTLEDTSYRLEFTYNTRSGQWTMSVLDIDLVPLIYGVPLVMNFSLFDQYPGRSLPAGEFYVVDTTEKEKAIDRVNMGTILFLVYIPEDELDTI